MHIDTVDTDAIGKVVDALVAALWDNDRHVQQSAATALGEIGDPRAVDALVAVLRVNDQDVRQKAENALTRIGDYHTVDALMEALRDDNKYVRAHAATALGTIGDPRSSDALLAVLGDREQQVRWSAIDALHKVGNPTIRQLTSEIAIIKCLEDVLSSATIQEVTTAVLEEPIFDTDRETIAGEAYPGSIDSMNQYAWVGNPNYGKVIGYKTVEGRITTDVPDLDGIEKAKHQLTELANSTSSEYVRILAGVALLTQHRLANPPLD